MLCKVPWFKFSNGGGGGGGGSGGGGGGSVGCVDNFGLC